MSVTTTKPKTVPYTMSLPDGNMLFVRIPATMTGQDRDGSLTFNPEGMKLLDHLRVLAGQIPQRPTPGYIKTIRTALKLTQADFADKLGYSTISIKKWETGGARPGRKAIQKIQRLVDRASDRGVVLETK